MSTQESAADILNSLSPEAKNLVHKVLLLERENLHLKNPTLLVGKIVAAVKEVSK